MFWTTPKWCSFITSFLTFGVGLIFHSPEWCREKNIDWVNFLRPSILIEFFRGFLPFGFKVGALGPSKPTHIASFLGMVPTFPLNTYTACSGCMRNVGAWSYVVNAVIINFSGK